MNTNAYPKPALWCKSPLPHHATWWSSVSAEAAIEFGSFRVLLRRRRLLADGVRVELGTRAFDLLLVLLEADGALVTKEELFRRVWPGIVVSEDNLKVQVSNLRKALRADRNFIRTEFGRGYRFTGVLSSSSAANTYRCATRARCTLAENIRIIHRWVVISTEGATTTATAELMLFSLMLHDARRHRF